MRASSVGLLILYPFRCRIGSTAPSRMGFKNLLMCQEVARGPVSDSPSPTTAATIRSGLSKAAQPFLVLTLLRVNLRIRTIQVDRAQHARRAMAGTCHKDHVLVVSLDDAVEVGIDECEARARSPMPQQPVLDLFRLERLLEQRIVAQI